MDRRSRENKKMQKRYNRLNKVWEEQCEEIEKQQKIQRERECELNSLRLAAEADKAKLFGDNVRILEKCQGCENCKNSGECYIVAVKK